MTIPAPSFLLSTTHPRAQQLPLAVPRRLRQHLRRRVRLLRVVQEPRTRSRPTYVSVSAAVIAMPCVVSQIFSAGVHRLPQQAHPSFRKAAHVVMCAPLRACPAWSPVVCVYVLCVCCAYTAPCSRCWRARKPCSHRSFNSWAFPAASEQDLDQGLVLLVKWVGCGVCVCVCVCCVRARARDKRGPIIYSALSTRQILYKI